jgi:hypothetical protein
MAAATTPIFPKAVETAVQDIVNADGTTPQTLVTAGADGALVYAVNAATDDTAAIDYSLYVQRDGAGVNFLLGTVSVPAASGNAAATPAVDLLDPAKIKGLDGDGNLLLGGTDILKVAARTAVTATKTTYVYASYGDF